MRASLQELKKIIKSEGIPKQITQQPFDHYPGHYRRLCELRGAEPVAADLVDYALDMQYMELQPELLRYLTPVLLQAWSKDLFEGRQRYGGFVEQFWPALLNGKALHAVFSRTEREAFVAYMRNSILDRLDAETSLRFSGMAASPYSWVQALVAYGTLFRDVEELWAEWWNLKTPGLAIAAFQYSSALMYEEDKNPIFDPWTADRGGGPPALWHCGALMYDVGWRTENLLFLQRTLSADYFGEKLHRALQQIENPATRKIAAAMVEDLPSHRTRLELRIEELPKLLMDVSRIEGFTI
jgi:hypothetical protein